MEEKCYEQYYATELAEQFCRVLSPSSPRAVLLIRWARGNFAKLNNLIGQSDSDEVDFIDFPRRKSDEVDLKQWNIFKAAIKQLKTSFLSVRYDIRKENLTTLANVLNLDAIDRNLVYLLFSIQTNELVERLFFELREGAPISNLFALVTGVTTSEIRRRLYSDTSNLIRCGVLGGGSGHYLGNDQPELLSSIFAVAQPPVKTSTEMFELLLGRLPKSELEMDDFAHIATDRDMIVRILDNAIKQQEKGVNILLYGAPGTGKTEFCKAAAAAVNQSLFAIGETDGSGNEPSRGERLRSMMLGHRLLSSQKQGLLLCDEMEDFWLGSMLDKASKIFANRILENNPLPVLWTCNSLDDFNGALLRRMTIIVEMKTPPVEVRSKIWKKLADDNDLVLSNRDIRKLAARYDESPGVVSAALKATRLCDGGVDETNLILNSFTKAISGGVKRKDSGRFGKFKPEITSADVDLADLTNKIMKSRFRAFSICLYGPPGTGKSAYARHLASKLKMEVVQKRASDLLSMWVGGSEKNIAEAFREAREKKALLIFDEADSLLSDRKFAMQNFEVSQVNEMLTWMESHPYPFVCTTNLMDRLDTASLRRFDFKINFNFMDKEARKIAFKDIFELEPPLAIAGIDNLTPGDFMVVKKKAKILGIKNNAQGLLDLLRTESNAKDFSATKKIGFYVN